MTKIPVKKRRPSWGQKHGKDDDGLEEERRGVEQQPPPDPNGILFLRLRNDVEEDDMIVVIRRRRKGRTGEMNVAINAATILCHQFDHVPEVGDRTFWYRKTTFSMVCPMISPPNRRST